ncbi:unnamed protein product [Dimorphilus gyrociliatus]|uniref:Glycosyl transferase 64 domain-containing protein n=1 Tax=Dimorphilus gyrociliatus TaxID=2664684 RepID=A0A7I8WB12_9ANNE|nr:unnamed protein product [Dimorphilus gyrociliatus]
MSIGIRRNPVVLFGVIIAAFFLLSFAYVTLSPQLKTRLGLGSDAVPLTDEEEFRSSNIIYRTYTYLEEQRLESVPRFVKFSADSKYTIVIPTYHRTNLIRRAVKHYANFKNISKIIIIWFNEERIPTGNEISKYVNKDNKVIIEVYWMPNLIRLRYFPYPTIDTEAVLNVDDDILIDEGAVSRAFQHWKVSKAGRKECTSLTLIFKKLIKGIGLLVVAFA